MRIQSPIPSHPIFICIAISEPFYAMRSAPSKPTVLFPKTKIPFHPTPISQFNLSFPSKPLHPTNLPPDNHPRGPQPHQQNLQRNQNNRKIQRHLRLLAQHLKIRRANRHALPLTRPRLQRRRCRRCVDVVLKSRCYDGGHETRDWC